MQGLVDVNSIEFLEPDLSIPTKDTVLNYNKDSKIKTAKDRAQKIYCDLSRVCEIEDAVVEWYDSKYFQRQKDLLNVSFFQQLFNIKKYECAGIDGLICKVHLQASKEGNPYYNLLNFIRSTIQ